MSYSNWRRRVWLSAVVGLGFYVEEPDPKHAGQVRKKPTIGFHDLRPENATEMVRAKVDMKTAQKRLGHAHPRLTLALHVEATDEGDEEPPNSCGPVLAGWRRQRPRDERAMNAR